VLSLLIVLSGLSATLAPTAAQTPGAELGDGVRSVSGSVTVSNPNAIALTSQAYMMLLDMTAFVERDPTLAQPAGSEVVAPLVGDVGSEQTFELALPIEPLGTLNDVSNGTGGGPGVQIFSVEYISNSVGDPFLGEYEAGGWGTAQTSLEVRGTDLEVVGGRMLVWAPDSSQAFPTGFGDDGLLFTDDDPTGPVEPGWTLVDLDAESFEFLRGQSETVEILPGEEGFSDYSAQGMVESFRSLLAELRLIYAFPDEKGIDFDALEAEYLPLIEDAERADDQTAFTLAMYRFALEFDDGHTASQIPSGYVASVIGGRLGFRVKPADSGETIVIGVTDGMPADDAGIEPGATIVAWDGGPVADAVAAEVQVNPASTEAKRQFERYQFLTRGPVGERVDVTFRNPGDDTDQTATLTFIEDIEGRDAELNAAIDEPVQDSDALPIQTRLLPSGVGYIRINSFFADPVFFTTAWDYAIRNLDGQGATGFLIDVRGNGGGLAFLPTYIAGTFYDEEFDLYEAYRPDREGGRAAFGPTTVKPVDLGVSDLPVGILTDINCASACEILTAAIAYDPEHLVISYTPTAGVEAGIYVWYLSGGLYFQSSYVRLENPDGGVFLEGYGVTPNVRIPAEAEYLILGDDDVALGLADEALTQMVEGDDPRNQPGGNIPPQEGRSDDSETTPAA
jgi:C-terminal processing protease CtpA/Prc